VGAGRGGKMLVDELKGDAFENLRGRVSAV